MTPLYYRLEGHEVVPASDEQAFNEPRCVGDTRIGDARVSTVFLVIDHNHCKHGLPIVFETMVFGGEHDLYCERYATWNEAEVGHVEACALVTASLIAEGESVTITIAPEPPKPHKPHKPHKQKRQQKRKRQLRI